MSATAPAHAAPTARAERLEVLDLLRGVAILGILLVNIFSFALPGEAFSMPNRWLEPTFADKVAFSFVNTFATMKLYSVLSMLFGVGLAIQTAKFDAAGESPRYLARTGLLLVFGLAHGLLFWWGDILATYAVASFIVYFLRGLQPRTMLFTAALILMVPVSCCTLGGGAATLGEDSFRAMLEKNSPQSIPAMYPPGPASFDSAPDPTGTPIAQRLSASMNNQDRNAALATEAWVYRNGGVLDIFVQRAFGLIQVFCCLIPSFITLIVPLMMTGVVAWRTGAFALTPENEKLHRRLALWGILLGVPFGALCTYSTWSGSMMQLIATIGLQQVQAITLGAGYVGLVCLWARSGALPGVRAALQRVGRMALSCYLLTSVLMTTVFYGYGGGLFGQFNYAALLLFVPPTWAVLIAFAWAWEKWVSPTGPIEGLWRAGTYRKG